VASSQIALRFVVVVIVVGQWSLYRQRRQLVMMAGVAAEEECNTDSHLCNSNVLHVLCLSV